ncbi:M24 family metallopeptidase [candidate division KSB3 bacterium]|uniref:M24 family metallopeptidase n=1 Tax=candidate division KSB3 bacterium TaxID=2044937 RepID=A0A9D5JY43_9BACT|nr:M24 family metallopeptidase [candidate division KSB3 bacterium]MBD3326106.1 M24 family metallopeptidase [candidate division KSB3 bacterium]
MTVTEKLDALRREMQQHQIDAWIVPTADPHHSEYVAPCWQTRAWMSGFTGSAGTLVVTQHRAGLWTDSRYFIQAASELAGSGIELLKLHMPDVPDYPEWLLKELPECAIVGFDGQVLSMAQMEQLQNVLAPKQVQFTVHHDLVAPLWIDRPPIPTTPVFLLDGRFAGESRRSKLGRLRHKLREIGADLYLLCSLDEIAWVFNIRGRDIAYNPVTISYATISEHEARLFINPEKVSEEVKSVLEEDGVMFSAYEEIDSYIAQLPDKSSVAIDPQKTSLALRKSIPSTCSVIEMPSLVTPLKAVKNVTEVQGIRHAHIRDGVALVKWLSWLDQQQLDKDTFTEFTITDSLEAFRRQGEYFQGLSFSPIAGYQANGAMCHYRAMPDTALTIKPEGLLLVDSGAQYLDGTTDITRTLTLSPPTREQRRDFTLVLKGHIALATAKFPKGTTGAQLDTFARAALWQHGFNYGHGTGHGVGHFLNVHEGPHSIHPRNTVPFEPGMLCSNEPGLYREGEYGIRIENLLLTVPAEETEFGVFCQFETVTQCPIDLQLVDAGLLSPGEKAWLNAYHETVYTTLAPFLADNEQAWLREATRPI